MQNTIIIGINSDIGTDLAKRFIKDGHNVLGTWRSEPAPVECSQVKLDVSTADGYFELEDVILDQFGRWDNLIFCVGNPLPLTKFLELDLAAWEKSVDLNGTAQLCLFHLLYEYRSDKPSVCFLAAGGVDSCPTEFSAYTLGKVVLVKACELIAAETPGLNIFTYGPGWVPTKTHKLMMENLSDGPRKEAISKYIATAPDIVPIMDEVYRDISTLLKDRDMSGKNFARGDRYFKAGPDCYFEPVPRGHLRIKKY